jgi:type IV pilus assembly protein PilM
MIFGSKAAVGLDIGSSYVKAVQLRRAGKSDIELERFGMAEIYPGGNKTAAGVNVHDVKVAAVKRALAEAHISAKQTVSAVSGESIIVRYIQLPNMPEEELRNALRWEAEEYIPFAIDDVNLDSVILGRSEDGEKVDVLLVSAKKDLVNSHLEIIRDAGLTPQIVDVDSFAFLNCFEVNYTPAAGDIVALVNIGAEITSINVYIGGVSRFSRDISIAGDAIARNIQAKLNCDWAQADRIKTESGAPESAEEPPSAPSEEMSLLETIRGTVEKITGENLGDDSTEAVAGRVIRSTLNSLVGEIRRSVQFFENQPNGRPVQKIIIGGGTAQMHNLDRFLAHELNLPVEIIDPFRRIGTKSRDVDKNLLESSKLMLGVGIGLALRKVVE